MSPTPQLSLSVHLPDDETFESYRSVINEPVSKLLSSFIAQEQLIDSGIHSAYLFGLHGVGKSHLLHACCAFAQGINLSSVCLSFSEKDQLSPEMLQGLENIDVICLDDIQFVSQDKSWQQAIFDLYNRVIEQDKRIIISGDQGVNELGLTLPDLASRLSWGHVMQIKPLSDDEKLEALQCRAQQRGLYISDEVGRFLLARINREMTSLLAALETLDKASIREQRRITIPFIKEVLLS
ncbi:DnaA regulatory inactivator Hda [Thalassotalea sediminis]|uniref:DnaA regulatory inactivator Hda n=1 Tax=Thalassotalea sediminis TaxID=1759089 RepID=UPI002573D991|nr:DnaA regulatory inactivator Hda [Thalassotalea sediminis]